MRSSIRSKRGSRNHWSESSRRWLRSWNDRSSWGMMKSKRRRTRIVNTRSAWGAGSKRKRSSQKWSGARRRKKSSRRRSTSWSRWRRKRSVRKDEGDGWIIFINEWGVVVGGWDDEGLREGEEGIQQDRLQILAENQGCHQCGEAGEAWKQGGGGWAAAHQGQRGGVLRAQKAVPHGVEE